MIGEIGRGVVETSQRVLFLSARCLFATAVMLLMSSTCQADDESPPSFDHDMEVVEIEPTDFGTIETEPADVGTVETEPGDTGTGEEMGGSVASDNATPDNPSETSTGTPDDTSTETTATEEDSSGTPPTDETSTDTQTKDTSSDETVATSTDSSTDPDGIPGTVVTTCGPGPIRYELMSMVNGDFNEPAVVDCFPIFLQPTLASFAASPNQRAVATAIDNITPRYSYPPDLVRIALWYPGPGYPGPAERIANEIRALPTLASQQAALASLSGEVYGTLQSLALQIGDRSQRVVSDRIINNDIFLNYGDAVLVSDRGTGNPIGSDPLVVRGQYSSSVITGWVQGYGNSGGWDSNGNAATTDYRLGGVSYGIDLGRDETGAIGITGGNSFTTYNTDLQDHGRITSYQVGVYLVKRIESAYLFSILSYGRNNYSVNRQLSIVGMGSPQSKFHGDMFSSYTESGLNLDWPSTRFQPFFALQTQMLSNSRAYETGTAGTASLNVAASNLNSLRTHLGGRLIAPALVDDLGIQWTPYMSARWVSDLAGQSPEAFASFSGGPAGASWTVTGNQSGRNFGLFGLGLNAQITDRLSLFGNYDYQVAARFHSHTGSGGLAFEF